MNLGIEQFRGIGTGRYDLDRTVALSRDGGLQRGESVLAQRVKGWANKLACHFGGQERRAGAGHRSRCSASCGRRSSERSGRRRRATPWRARASGESPLTSRQITRALAIADQYRLGAVRANEDKLSAACGKIADPVVRQALAKLVRTDPGYGSGRLSDAHMEALGQRADDKVAAAREQRRSSAIRLAAYARANGIAFAETAGKPLESLPRGMLTEASVRQAGCGAALTPRM